MSYDEMRAEVAEFHRYFNFVERNETDTASRRDTAKENAARPASVQITHISTGVGQHRVDKPVRFPVTFRAEPHFTSGSATIKHANPKTWHDPIGTAGVTAWVRDSDGNFVGAKIWVRVDMYPVDPGNPEPYPAVSTRHYMTFSALAIKDLPRSALNPQLTPRAVDLLRGLPAAE